MSIKTLTRWLMGMALLVVAACAPFPTMYAPDEGEKLPKTGNETVYVYPGSGAEVRTYWIWDQQGVESSELKAVVDPLDTPQAISSFLLANYPWQDNYDIAHFLSPNALVEQKRGVCSAFARFWQYALQRNGITAHFIAFFSPASGHAVTVFKDPTDNRWRMGSNQFFHDREDLDPTDTNDLDVIFTNATKVFYGSRWNLQVAFDYGGAIRYRKTNPEAPPMASDPLQMPYRFDIKR